MSNPLTSLLNPGEKILWQGQPRPYVFMLRGLPAIAYGITWGVLGAYWFHGARLAQFQNWWVIVPWLAFPFILAGFSFWFYPMSLGAKARRTWYCVTTQRIFIAEFMPRKVVALRVFSKDELAPPEIKKRFDGLYDVILTKRAQKNPHLPPGLDQGFFGLPNGEPAAAAINETTNP